MRERIKLGIAMAAMIRMIATTIKSSMSENPLEPRFIPSSSAIPRLQGKNEVGYRIFHSASLKPTPCKRDISHQLQAICYEWHQIWEDI
jgi:hypothetical protein